MSRVQCLDCAGPVVVDPAGRCPEGHLVGAAGARIAQAIGADVPHPEEPEPWVATVVLEDELGEDVDGDTAATPRPIQPPPAPRTPTPPRAPAPPAAPEATHDPVDDSEEFLRELHALSELSGDTAASATRSGVGPTPPAPPVPPVAARRPAASAETARTGTSTPPVSRPSSDEVAEGLAEFSALEAAVQALDAHGIGNGTVAEHHRTSGSADTPPAPAVEPDVAIGDLEELFAAASTSSVPDRVPADPTVGATAERADGHDAPAAQRRHLHLAPPVPASTPASPPPPSTVAVPADRTPATPADPATGAEPAPATAAATDAHGTAPPPPPPSGARPADADVTTPDPTDAGAADPVDRDAQVAAPGASTPDPGVPAPVDDAPGLDPASFTARGPSGAGRRGGKRRLLRR